MGIYFRQMSVIYFCRGFSCCPYYRGVRNSEMSATRELTVIVQTKTLDSPFNSKSTEDGCHLKKQSFSTAAQFKPIFKISVGLLPPLLWPAWHVLERGESANPNANPPPPPRTLPPLLVCLFICSFLSLHKTEMSKVNLNLDLVDLICLSPLNTINL